MGKAVDSDVAWMALALSEAHKGVARTSPNPPVGCVLVKKGREVGRGFHARFGGPHAEVVALRKAGGRARGATAYVTLEPCCHTGKTPPCTRALAAAGVERVVVGALDPNSKVARRGLAALRRAGVGVRSGVMRAECDSLIRGFRLWVSAARPWVTLKLAASLDGRIATRTGESKWISSPPSRRMVQRLRARSDGLLVGVGTVLADDPRLNCRLAGSPNPLRVVLDRRLRTPPSARVVSGPGKALILAAPSAPASRRRRLEAAGAEVLLLDTRGKAGWVRILKELGRRGILELMIEGGSAVATSALRAGVVNQAVIFYNPRFFGGDGLPLVGPLGVSRPAAALAPETSSWSRSGEDIVWTGTFR
ncbi:MAG: bifunctional diaminohydroxyphosphoribosylaminopyrimidine deaminase/5-amino-6-(5-phosphoribosylamino)uracil reductase RibD [Deltaproteobacteria bacterium]